MCVISHKHPLRDLVVECLIFRKSSPIYFFDNPYFYKNIILYQVKAEATQGSQPSKGIYKW